MQKLRKVFSLGLVVAAVAALGLMVSSCVEPKDTFRVTIESGDYETQVGEQPARPGADGSGTEYEEGETITIKAGTPPAGKVFFQWTTSDPDVVFYDSSKSTTTFTMPGRDVRVTAWFKDAPVVTPDEDTYIVTVNGGEAEYTEYEEGEEVEITADTYEDSLFFKWTTTTTGVKFDSDTLPTTTFVMPDRDVTVTATFVPKGPAVRFAWEAAQQSKIWYIWAKDNEVATWKQDIYTNIYLANLKEGEDILGYVSHIPLYDGSDQLPEEIYNLDKPTNTEHKGKYYAIDADDYTAICTVIDDVNWAEPDTFDIVANYTITDKKPFFEVGFDIALFIDPELNPGYEKGTDPDPDTYLSLDSYDNPYKLSHLVKAKAKGAKLLKTLKKGNVTYYVLKRPRK